MISTPNIITGKLNIKTITLPNEKFLLFNKFIEAEIEARQHNINEPIKYLQENLIMGLNLINAANKFFASGEELGKITPENFVLKKFSAILSNL